jgi:hypothetical protein
MITFIGTVFRLPRFLLFVGFLINSSAVWAGLANPLIDVGVNLSSSTIVQLNATTSIRLKFVGAVPDEGEAELNVTSGGKKIVIYDQNGSAVTLPKKWNMDNTADSFPLTYQVEGVTVSSSKDDVTVGFSHTVKGKTRTKSAKLTVMKSSISVPAATQDGSPSDFFNIEIEPKDLTPDSYEWIYVIPSGAGRAPTGDIFDDKTKKKPKVTSAMWFAPTNNEDRLKDGPTCTYKIKCKIKFGLDEYETQQLDWNVWAYKNPVTTPSGIEVGSNGVLTFSLDVDGQVYTYEVVGHNMTRSTPTINADGMLATNSFYGKVIESHEGRHVTQWSSVIPWKDYYMPSKVYQLFVGKKKSGTESVAESWRDALRIQAVEVFTKYRNSCITESNRTQHHREHDAHAISNSVGPAYLKSVYVTEYPDVQTPVGDAPEPTIK